MKYLKYSCPQCNHTLYRGTLEFGPSTVQCKKCNNTFCLNLTPWKELTIFSKIINVLKELIAPSFLLGLDSAILRFLLFVPACWVLFSFPFTIPIMLITNKTITFSDSIMQNAATIIAIGLLIFGSLIYPIYVIKRLFKIIFDSYKYEKKGIYPKW